MKKIYLSIIAAAAFSFTASAQTDLAIGNIDAGFDYNEQTGIISDIYFTVLSNENQGATNFKVGIYFVPKNANSLDDAFLLASKTMSSINGNSAGDIEGWTVDANTNQDLESGDYRLLVAVDYDKKITETNEDNNSLFLSSQGNDLTFTQKGGNTGFGEAAMGLSTFNIYPNPAHDALTVNITSATNTTVTCNIMDISGKLISSNTMHITPAGMFTEVSLDNLPEGVYTILLANEKGTAVKRFTRF